MTYAIATPEKIIHALADPTRRAIVSSLSQGASAVGQLAKGLPVSRPAVSQHLRILTDAGLLTVTQCGTKRLYQLAPDGVAPLRRYLDLMWNDALASFEQAAIAQANTTANTMANKSKDS